MKTDSPELNDRQWTYLQALYEEDQKAEAWAKGAWSRGEHSRPASEWRWIAYDHGPLGEDSELQAELRRSGVLDPGAGSTWAALADRGLVLVRRPHVPVNLGIASGYVQVVDVQLTREGRKLVRSHLGDRAPRPLKTGDLREWHWKALVLAYKAGEKGVAPTGGGWGHVGWNTWERLARYKAGALVEVVHPDEWSDRARITPFGRQYYRAEHARYRKLYPDIEAPEPASSGGES